MSVQSPFIPLFTCRSVDMKVNAQVRTWITPLTQLMETREDVLLQPHMQLLPIPAQMCLERHRFEYFVGKHPIFHPYGSAGDDAKICLLY